ncbi:MAG: hypothetical protein NT041_00310 [Candidatus Vogelbacteria bacterium]|nr:hypothetical protein [Candidatus Vogelbacteria bacterium]
MRHIIWRNRASAVLGLVVMLVPFTGFPEVMRESLVVLAGFLIVVFGFSRSYNTYAYSSDEEKAVEDGK